MARRSNVAKPKHRPWKPVTFSYENGLNGWISRSRVQRNALGRAVWRAAL